MSSIETRDQRWNVLLLSAAAFVLVFLLWQVASVSALLYPFRLMVTFVHEAGHGLSAILTGGRFIEFRVFPDGSGVAYMAGGSPFVWVQAGYLGAALFGAVLFYFANRTRQVNVVAFFAGLFFVGCGVFFSGQGGSSLLIGIVIALALYAAAGMVEKQSLRNARYLQLAAFAALIITLIIVWNDLELIVGVIAGVVLIALGALASPVVTLFALNFLAFLTGFNAISDIAGLWGSIGSSLSLGGQTVRNDAVALADLTKLPAQLWILIWIALALLMMGVSLYFAVIKPAREQQSVSRT